MRQGEWHEVCVGGGQVCGGGGTLKREAQLLQLPAQQDIMTCSSSSVVGATAQLELQERKNQKGRKQTGKQLPFSRFQLMDRENVSEV